MSSSGETLLSEASALLSGIKGVGVNKDKKEKILAILEQLRKETDDVAIQNEKLKCEAEKRCDDLEKKVLDAQKLAKSESTKQADLRSQLESSAKKLDEATGKLKSVDDSQEVSLNTQLRLQQRNDQLENEKRELAVGLERKNASIEQLSQDYKRVNSMLADSNSVKYDYISKYEDANSRLVSLEFRQRKTSHENESLSRQLLQRQREVDEKSEEVLACRREQTAKLADLQMELEHKSEEGRHLESKVSGLDEKLKAAEENCESYVEKLKQLQELHQQQADQHRNEMAAQSRLSNIYKIASQENDGKVLELTKAVEELQKLLDQATSAYQKLADDFSNQAAEVNAETEAKQSRIESLESELSNANLLLAEAKKGAVPLTDEDVESLAPSAAAAAKMLRSGMSLSQIYNEYVKVSNQLEEVTADNSQLKASLESIFNELEAKAPILKKQREDYEQAMSTIDQLSGANAKTLSELEALQREKEGGQRKTTQLSRENLRYRQETKDLSLQVQYLIKEVEEARGRKVVSEKEASFVSSTTPNGSGGDATTAEAVVSGRLVLFRTIEEMQLRNRELLAVVRELSEQKELEEQEATDKKVVELKSELDSVKRDLEEMVEARERQKVLVDSIIGQRDSYRFMLSQINGTDFSLLDQSASSAAAGDAATTPRKPPTPGAGSSRKSLDSSVHRTPPPASPVPQRQIDASPIALNASLLQSQAKAATLQAEVDRLHIDLESGKFELESLKTKYDEQKTEREALIDKLRDEATDLKVQNSQLSSQLEFATSTQKVSQSNNETQKKEIKTLNDKNVTLNAAVSRQEEVAKTLTKENLRLQENISTMEITDRTTRQEVAQLKTMKASMQVEVERLQSEASMRDSIVGNLERINNVLQFQEESIKTRLEEENRKLTRDVDSLQRKLDSEREQSQVAAAAYDGQIRELRGQLETELRAHQASRESMGEMRLENERTKMKLENLEKSIPEVENAGPSGASSASTSAGAAAKKNAAAAGSKSAKDKSSADPEEVAETQESADQTIVAQSKTISTLRSQTDQYKRHVIQYQAMVSSLENTLTDQRKTSDEIQDSLQLQLKDRDETSAKMSDRIKNLEDQKNKLIDEKESLQKEMNTLTTSWNDRVHDMREDLNSTKANLLEAERKMTATRETLDETVERKDLLEKTTAELKKQLVSATQTLAAKNSEVEALNEKLASSQFLEVKAVEEHKAAESEWASSRDSLNQQIQSQQDQLTSLKKQNETLTADLQSLSSQVMARVTAGAGPSTDKDAAAGGKTGESPETPTSGKGRQVTRGYSLRSAGSQRSGESEELTPGAPEKKKDAAVAENPSTEEQSKEGSAISGGGIGDESLQTPEQMINVNRFLRREKEIAETRVEILQAEVSRLKQHTEYVEKQMAQAHKTLASERQRATIHVKSATEHAELLRKVETVNTLTSLNKKMKEENERLVTEGAQLNAKIARLEADILPIEAARRDLQATVDVIPAEKNAFTQESKRWQTRVDKLIEMKNKTEAEENRKLVEERKSHEKQITDMNEEVKSVRSEVKVWMDNCHAAQAETAKVKEELSKRDADLAAEIAKAQSFSEEMVKKDEELLGKTQAINQLRNLGRKYKNLSTESDGKLKKVEDELNALKKSYETDSADKQKELESKEATLLEEVQRLKAQLESTETQLSSQVEVLTQERNALQERANELQQAQQPQQQMSSEDKDSSSLALLEQRAQMDAIKSKMGHLEKTNTELTKKNEDMAKESTRKESSFKETMTKVKSSLMTKTEALRAEVRRREGLEEEKKSLATELTTTKAEVQALKTRLEASEATPPSAPSTAPPTAPDGQEADNKLQVLQAELDALQEERNTLVVERNELRDKVEELQSEVESLRSAVSANQKATSVISPAVERPSSSENPTSVPTANIRPLPSPHGGAFHHAGPSSSRSVAATSRQSATATVMGARHHSNRGGDRERDPRIATVCPQPAAPSSLPSSSSSASTRGGAGNSGSSSSSEVGVGQVLRMAVAPTITVSPQQSTSTTGAEQSSDHQLQQQQQQVVSQNSEFESGSGVGTAADTSSRGGASGVDGGQFSIVSVQGAAAAATPSSQVSPVASSSTVAGSSGQSSSSTPQQHQYQGQSISGSGTAANASESMAGRTSPSAPSDASADIKEPPSTSGQPQLQEASMSSSVNSSAAAAAANTSGAAASTAAKRGRPSDSSTPGGEEPDTDISPKNKRSRVIFIDPTESPQNLNSDAVTSSEPAFPSRNNGGISVVGLSSANNGGASSSSQMVLPLQLAPPIAVLFPSPVTAEESSRQVGSTDASASQDGASGSGGASLLRVVDTSSTSSTERQPQEASLADDDQRPVDAAPSDEIMMMDQQPNHSNNSNNKVSTSAWIPTSTSSTAASMPMTFSANIATSQNSQQAPTSTKTSTPDPQEDDDDPDCIVVESDDDDDDAPPPPKLQGVGRGFRGRRGRGVPFTAARGGVSRWAQLNEEEEGLSGEEEEEIDSEMEGDEVEDGEEEEYGEEEEADEERIDDEEEEEYYEEGEMRGDIEEEEDSRPSFDRDPESLDGDEDVTYEEEEDEEERLASSSTRHRQPPQQQARQSDSNDDIVIVEDDAPEESSSVPPALQRPSRTGSTEANVAAFAAATNLPPLVMTGSSASPFATPGGGEEDRGLSSSSIATHRESSSRLVPPDSEDCQVPSTPTLIPHQSSSVSSHARSSATSLGASSGALSGHGADVASPSVPHTPLDADDVTRGSGNAAMAPARFVFGSAASVQSDLTAGSSGSLQSSLMDRQMDLRGMIPNPVVTSSSSSSAAATTLLSFASAAATRDNEAVRVEDDDDDDVATYHPTPSEGDNTEEEGEGRGSGGTSATSAPATSTTSSVAETGRSISVIPTRGGVARRSRGGGNFGPR